MEKFLKSKDTLRILVIAASYKPAYVYGGPIRVVGELCENLSKRGIDVSVFTTTANGNSELDVQPGCELKIDGVSVTFFSRWSGDHTHLSPGLLMAVFKRCKQYDVVHIQSWWNLVSVLSTFLCVLRRKTPLLTLHGTLSQPSFEVNHAKVKRVLHRILGRSLLIRSTLHVTSTKESEEVARIVPGAKQIMIPNLLALPKTAFRERLGDRETLHLLFVGRLHPIKNLELLFESLGQLNGIVKWRLSIVGSGDEHYISNLKAKAEMGSQVEWLGEMDGDAKFKLMAESDLLVLLSHTENFGNVVIESLSQGTAVLVSKYVGVAEYVTKHQLGWVIDTTTQCCTEAIQSIALASDARNAIRLRAPQCVMNDFSTEMVIKEYVSAYQQLVHS